MNNDNINPLKLTSSLTDPQIKLTKALLSRNIEEFRAALKIGANPLAIDDQHLSVFEKALQTPGCDEYVSECLKSGCDPNYSNTFYNKAAINFAADSRDPQILRALLNKTSIQVDHVYSALTPLNSLTKNLSNENFTQALECIKILLSHGASPNIPDQREMTPLHNLIKNRKITDAQKYEVVQLFLKLPNINIDTYREGELRHILESEYPLMELPHKNSNNLITFHMLLTNIRSGNMDLFQEQYDNVAKTTTKEEDVELLVESIKRGAHQAFDLLLEKGVDYNGTVKHNNIPIQIAWIYGNWYALDRLLQRPDIQLRPKDHPLSNIVCKLNESSHRKFCDYWKCFYILLGSDKIDINAKDFSRSTALHYAVKYHNNQAVKELLKRGAGICIENIFHDLPLNGMSPVILEEHLNECISSNEEKFGDKDYEIIINFKNFVLSTQSSEKQLNEVLTPIVFMAKSKEYRYLLQHPVITSILYLKWHKLSLIFYINFLLYLFFASSVITYSVLKFRESEYELAKELSFYCSWLGICYLILREFLQFIVSPLTYLSSITNYLEILLIIFSTITCNIFRIDYEMQRNTAVACILLLAYELVLLVGSLPVSSISTHMLMLEAVCKSFVRCFLLYSIFIITFTLCFYIKNDKLVANDNQKNSEEAFHRFSNPLTAFAKTIVMFTGEFDAGSMRLDSNYSYLLFLSFVFFMTIILFNLLNGLAVSDTQTIKNQAELNEIICRINLLARYEKTVFKQTGCSLFSTKRQPFRTLCYIFKKLFPTYTTDVEISILPNDKNRILKSKTKMFKGKAKDIERHGRDAEVAFFVNENDNDRNVYTRSTIFDCYFSFITKACSRIDKRTVAQAMAVLERKSMRTIENRLEGMEEKLNRIIEGLDIFDSKPSLNFL